MTKQQIIELVIKGIKTGDYRFIDEAERNCPENVFMGFDDEFVAVDDDIFYFNGAF